MIGFSLCYCLVSCVLFDVKNHTFLIEEWATKITCFSFWEPEFNSLKPTLDGPQPPEIPAPEDLVPCFRLQTHTHMHNTYV